MIVIQISTIILTILVGLAVGSFLNVVIYRLPNNMSLSRPKSHCPKCEHSLAWYDNIPLLSYVMLGGKCRFCKTKISLRYPLIEFTNMVLWFLCLMMFTNFIIPSMTVNWYRFACYCIICSTLICIFFIDLDHLVIHDVLQIVLLICAIVLIFEDLSWQTLLNKAIGCVVSGLIFYLVRVIFKLVKHKEALGLGDVFLVAIMGLALGGYRILFALILSCLVGGIILLTIALINKDKNKQYPFALLLVPGFLVSMFVGDYVVNFYLSLLGVTL